MAEAVLAGQEEVEAAEVVEWAQVALHFVAGYRNIDIGCEWVVVYTLISILRLCSVGLF